MARIQVLPLTTESVGPITSTPFVIIIDQTADDFDGNGVPIYTPEIAEVLTRGLGARQVLVLDGRLDVANVDVELQEAARAAVLSALRAD